MKEPVAACAAVLDGPKSRRTQSSKMMSLGLSFFKKQLCARGLLAGVLLLADVFVTTGRRLE